MGRKIPGKKHHGVKDPVKQRAKRLAELAPKINAPPKDADEQAIPRSLEKIIRLKEAVKSGRIGKTKTRKKKKTNLICVGGQNSRLSHPKAKPEKAVPVFQQRPGETYRHFMYRVSKETHAFLKESDFENKYNVMINRNPETGAVEGLSKYPKDELEELARLQTKHKNIKRKKKIKDEENNEHLTKAQKRKQKLQIKKQKKEEETVDDFQFLQDDIKFGEIVHAPPQLSARPKKANSTHGIKLGRTNLLLNSLFAQNSITNVNSTKSVPIDRSGKRKKLPVSQRRQLEKEQTAAIAAYRSIKVSRKVC